MSKNKLLELCEQGPFFDVCVYDCLSAKVVEKAGFKAMCLSGASLALAYCGFPDIGIVTVTEVAEMVRRITSCTSLPLIVDIDSGFGNEMNLIRTCKLIAEAGASAVHLEDQTFPKRTPTMPGFSLISRDDWKRMLEAALYGLRDTNCQLIARTDSRVLHDVDECVARMKIATEMGVQMTLPIGLYDKDEIAYYMSEVPGYKMYEYLSMPGSLRTTEEEMSRTFDDCAKLGYTMMSVPAVSLFGALYGIKRFANSLYKNNHDFDIIRDMKESDTSFPYFIELTEREKWLNWDKRH